MGIPKKQERYNIYKYDKTPESIPASFHKKNLKSNNLSPDTLY